MKRFRSSVECVFFLSRLVSTCLIIFPFILLETEPKHVSLLREAESSEFFFFHFELLTFFHRRVAPFSRRFTLSYITHNAVADSDAVGLVLRSVVEVEKFPVYIFPGSERQKCSSASAWKNVDAPEHVRICTASL